MRHFSLLCVLFIAVKRYALPSFPLTEVTRRRNKQQGHHAANREDAIHLITSQCASNIFLKLLFDGKVFILCCFK